jgi:WD40 repeat protein
LYYLAKGKVFIGMNYTGKTVQKLEILIEENAFGSVRPVQAVADAPVSALVPALVEELKLPQTDLFGKKLTYILRRAESGNVIPEYSTLLASGVMPGERLALDSFTSEEVNWNALYSSQSFTGSNMNSSLHSSNTLNDLNMADLEMVPAVKNTTTDLPPLKKERKWTRRAFLLLGGAAIGAAGTGIGYAAYRNYLSRVNLNQVVAQQQPVHKATVVKSTPKPTPTPPTIPTSLKLQTTFARHQQLVRSVAWSPDGTMLASGADDSHVFVWGTNGAVQVNIAHPASVQSLAWSPDGKRLVTGSGVQLAFFDTQTGKRLARSIHAHTRMITSVAWATEGLMRVVSAGDDDHAIVWNTTSYQIQTVYRLHNAPIENVAWSSDGQTVATSSEGGYIRVWNASSGIDVHSHYQDTTVPIRALAFSPTSALLAAGCDDGIVRLWSDGLICQNPQGQGVDSICGDAPLRVRASTTAVRTVAWSHDGRFLAVGTDDGMLSIWDPKKPQQPLLKSQQKLTVHSVAWSPDNKYLAVASGNTVTTWMVV